MNKKYVFLISFLIVFSLVYYFLVEKHGGPVIAIETKGKISVIKVMIADEEPERIKGLMFKKNLGNFKGMFFIFDNQEIIKMWMKNTFLPLDMVFFNEKGLVVNVKENAIPKSLDIISSINPAKFVLELQAKKVLKYGITNESRILYVKYENKVLHFEKK